MWHLQNGTGVKKLQFKNFKASSFSFEKCRKFFFYIVNYEKETQK